MGTMNTIRLNEHGKIGNLYITHYKPGIDEEDENNDETGIEKFRFGRKLTWMTWPVDFSLEEAKCLHRELSRILK